MGLVLRLKSQQTANSRQGSNQESVDSASLFTLNNNATKAGMALRNLKENEIHSQLSQQKEYSSIKSQWVTLMPGHMQHHRNMLI